MSLEFSSSPQNVQLASVSLVRRGLLFAFLDCLTIFAIFAIYAASRTPAVNEAHYLTKAKHFWNPDFGGTDLFLQSADAHWLFFVIFGWPTLFVSLGATAWIGRIACWLALAAGWSKLMRTLSPIQLAGTATAPLFLTALHCGHLSGEWVVGGCEAKCIAYAAAFAALSCVIRHRWPSAAVCFGIACAFHILTGGWILLSTIAVLVLRRLVKKLLVVDEATSPEAMGSLPHPLRQTIAARRLAWLGYPLASGLLLFGLIPALRLNWNVQPGQAYEAAIIYVYTRLPHHLSMGGFSVLRWKDHTLLIATTLAVGLWAWTLFRVTPRMNSSGRGHKSSATGLVASSTTASTRNKAITDRFDVAAHLPIAQQSYLNDWPLLLQICAFGPLLALCGMIIDASLASWATNWSANLLRYYWFRWNDVAWPLALCSLCLLILNRIDTVFNSRSWQQINRVAVWAILIIPGTILLLQHYRMDLDERLPPADQNSLVFLGETPIEQQLLYADWLDACRWIRDETPSDALFLTPRNQQTFKWNAGRSEVVCWKDSPQNAADLLEWHRRLHRIFPADAFGGPVPLTTERAIDLYREYRFQFVLLDRRVNRQPLAIPLLYQNENYAVFEFETER